MRFKRTGIFTKIILAILLIYAVTHLVVLRSKIENAEDKQHQLEQAMADKMADIEEKQYAIDHKDDSSVIEDIAREEGYVYRNEDVYYAG